MKATMKPPEISPHIPTNIHSNHRRRLRGGMARASYSVDLETGLHIRAPTTALTVDTASRVPGSPPVPQEYYRLIEYNDDDIQTLQSAYMNYITDSMHLGRSARSPTMPTPMPPAVPPGTPYHRARTSRYVMNELHLAPLLSSSSTSSSSSSSYSSHNAPQHIFSPLVPATLLAERVESPELSGSEDDDGQRMQRQRDLLEIMESLANIHNIDVQETIQLRARSPSAESILDGYLDVHSDGLVSHQPSATSRVRLSTLQTGERAAMTADRSCLIFSHPTLNDQIKCVCPCSRSADGEYWTPDRCLCYRKQIMETEYHCSNSHRNVPMR